MTIENNDEEHPITNDSCSLDRCNEDDEGSTHYHCSECGFPVRFIPPVNGFVPTNPNRSTPTVNRRVDSLGSEISPSDNPRYRWLSELHRHTSYEKPSFVDGIVRELLESGEGERIVAEAAGIINSANSCEALGRKRHGLNGLPGTSEEDDRVYRQRLYAVAALHILNCARRDNRAFIIKEQWNPDRQDFLKTVSILRKLVRDDLGALRTSENYVVERAKDIRHRMSNCHDHLISMFGPETASNIVYTARMILRRNGEPFEDFDEWLSGPWMNKGAAQIVMMAIVQAMLAHDFDQQRVFDFYRRVPVPNMDSWISRNSSAAADGEPSKGL
jgi:hypothetical protein